MRDLLSCILYTVHPIRTPLTCSSHISWTRAGTCSFVIRVFLQQNMEDLTAGSVRSGPIKTPSYLLFYTPFPVFLCTISLAASFLFLPRATYPMVCMRGQSVSGLGGLSWPKPGRPALLPNSPECCRSTPDYPGLDPNTQQHPPSHAPPHRRPWVEHVADLGGAVCSPVSRVGCPVSGTKCRPSVSRWEVL